MPTPAYLTVKGKIQGLITENASTQESIGGVSRDDHRHESTIHAYSHETTSPYDLHSGSSTGPCLHGPVCVTKSFDKASPLLLQALVDGEELDEVIIKWYRTDNGIQKHYYTTTLNDAKVVAIKDYMPNCQDPGNSHFTHLQDVHFRYRDIINTHVTSNTEGSDKWGKSKQE